MRRKSERNKAKASPEKKVEKPTRKSTRRRAKKSPSTSPDRDNSNDSEALQKNETESTVFKIQTRLHNKDIVETTTTTINDEPEAKVSSTEVIVQQEVGEDSDGSVWKAARADASPGEIPKLKLCRQRNLSETSDVSLNRKRTNKWQESSDGVAEEADSADERPATSGSMTDVGNEPADNPSSTLPDRDSLGEEVSDSKEIPPEKASADLSDDKPNIDRQDDTIETPNSSTDKQRNVDSDELTVENAEEVPETLVMKTEDIINGEQENEETIAEVKTPERETVETTKKEELLSKKKELPVKKMSPVREEPEEESSLTNEENQKNDQKEKEKEKTKDDSVAMEIKNQEPEGDDLTVKKVTKTGKNIMEVQKQASSSEEDEKEQEKQKKKAEPSGSSDNSCDESKERIKISVTRAPARSSRRKHRDKYRDSSNSDSVDSDDEPPRRIKEVEKDVEEEEEESEPTREESPEASGETEKEKEKSPKKDEVLMQVNEEKTEIEGENEEKIEQSKASNVNEKTEIVTNLEEKVHPCKPAKVNLKRSFARVSVETVESKKDTITANDASQDKENHVSGDQVEISSIPKRRRWGTARTADVTPAFSISTDSLKTLVPGAKPLSISEVRLTKDDDDVRDRRREREKRYGVVDGPVEKPKDDADMVKNENMKSDNHIAARRKISIVKDTPHPKSPSPSQAQISNILLIKNLVRPFTLGQIKELLSRTGTIVENGFWMDRIKSKAFVEYLNEDQAFETRQALHGISWPLSNPKKLQVEYASKEDMELARESSKDQLPPRKTDPMAATDVWQQDWGRDEKSNATTKVTVVREWDLGKEDGQHLMKEKEREKKDLEKKRRQRSRSPASDPHLPASARKFKKKEDEPPPAKLLDDLFRKTKATPCIYWLPLTNEQIVVKEEMRRQHMAEHARRLEEMRRAERNRDGRRRRSPRK